MKIAPINSCYKYPKTNLQPQSNKTSFGNIEDPIAKQLMQEMGMDPKNPLYDILEFTLYSVKTPDGRYLLKGRPTVDYPATNTFNREYYLGSSKKKIEARLAAHQNIMHSRELADEYFKIFNNIFHGANPEPYQSDLPSFFER